MFTEVTNQVRINFIFLIDFYTIKLPSSGTSGVAPCWPLENMQFKGTWALTDVEFATSNHYILRR